MSINNKACKTDLQSIEIVCTLRAQKMLVHTYNTQQPDYNTHTHIDTRVQLCGGTTSARKYAPEQAQCALTRTFTLWIMIYKRRLEWVNMTTVIETQPPNIIQQMHTNRIQWLDSLEHFDVNDDNSVQKMAVKCHANAWAEFEHVSMNRTSYSTDINVSFWMV